MITQSGTLTHYLTSFILYTLGAIGLIYAVYVCINRSGGRGKGFAVGKRKQSPQTPLAAESVLSLEPRKTLYIIRAGHERFLVAGAGDDLKLLSRLEAPLALVTEAEIPKVEETERLEPWYQAVPEEYSSEPGFRQRFMQSIAWLASSRLK